MRVRRHAVGSVRYDKRRRTWNYLWYEAGKRRSKMIGTKQDFPTKASAWKAVERLDAGKVQNTNGTLMRNLRRAGIRSASYRAITQPHTCTTSPRAGEIRQSTISNRGLLNCG